MIDKFKEYINHPYDAIMEGIDIDLKNKIVVKSLDDTDKINDKNVLILDDTVTSGSTISLFTKDILEMSKPLKITVITLFSRIKP